MSIEIVKPDNLCEAFITRRQAASGGNPRLRIYQRMITSQCKFLFTPTTIGQCKEVSFEYKQTMDYLLAAGNFADFTERKHSLGEASDQSELAGIGDQRV